MHGKKGNENAFSTYTSRMHFACVCVCASMCLAKGINRQREKEKEERIEKIKSDPFLFFQCLHGCLSRRERQINCLDIRKDDDEEEKKVERDNILIIVLSERGEGNAGERKVDP